MKLKNARVGMRVKLSDNRTGTITKINEAVTEGPFFVVTDDDSSCGWRTTEAITFLPDFDKEIYINPAWPGKRCLEETQFLHDAILNGYKIEQKEGLRTADTLMTGSTYRVKRCTGIWRTVDRLMTRCTYRVHGVPPVKQKKLLSSEWFDPDEIYTIRSKRNKACKNTVRNAGVNVTTCAHALTLSYETLAEDYEITWSSHIDKNNKPIWEECYQ